MRSPTTARSAVLVTAAALGAAPLLPASTTASPLDGDRFPGKNGLIVYELDDGNDDEIYLINKGGGGRPQLTDNDRYDEDPSWSPNGKRIVFEEEDPDDEIYTIKPNGGGTKRLTDNAVFDSNPDWGIQP